MNRNPPPMFTILATKVAESQQMWLPVVLVRIRNISLPKSEIELIVLIAPTENDLNVKYLENGERYDDGIKGSQIKMPQ